MIPPAATSLLLESPAIAHGFFGRMGGVSTGLLASLNVGRGTRDDPANVDENRRRIRDALGARDLVTVYQIHSATVVTVDPSFAATPPQADALVTRTPGLALGILTADCCPILLADPVAGVIGAAHAGWQGALAGIAPATVAAMIALGARAADLRAAVGPAIQQPSYEVGADLRDRFIAGDPANARHFTAGAALNRFQFDLPGFVLAQLLAAGVRAETTGLDTYPAADRYFSYRRATHAAEPDYGRQMAAICLKAAP